MDRTDDCIRKISMHHFLIPSTIYTRYFRIIEGILMIIRIDIIDVMIYDRLFLLLDVIIHNWTKYIHEYKGISSSLCVLAKYIQSHDIQDTRYEQLYNLIQLYRFCIHECLLI